MNEVAPNTPATADRVPGSLIAAVARVAHIIFYLAAAAVLYKNTFSTAGLDEIPWAELFFVLAAAASIVLAMSQALPLQNVLLAAFIVGAVGAVVNAIAIALNQTFGRFAFAHALVREPILEAFPWIVCLL